MDSGSTVTSPSAPRHSIARAQSGRKVSRWPNLSSTIPFKPAQEKWFPAKIYQPGERIVPEGESGSLPDDFVYVQEAVCFINEVRCFCLDGKVHTASYYRVSGQYHCSNLDEERPKVIDDMVKELAPHYPRGVVLDFGYTDRGEWSFLEPNECWCAGVYSADYTKCLDVIEASQEDK